MSGVRGVRQLARGVALRQVTDRQRFDPKPVLSAWSELALDVPASRFIFDPVIHISSFNLFVRFISCTLSSLSSSHYSLIAVWCETRNDSPIRTTQKHHPPGGTRGPKRRLCLYTSQGALRITSPQRPWHQKVGGLARTQKRISSKSLAIDRCNIRVIIIIQHWLQHRRACVVAFDQVVTAGFHW